jgi:predicted dehydrogenase
MLRVGVVGAGHMGWLHARQLVALDDVQFSAIHDPIAARAERVAQEFSAEVVPSASAVVETSDAVIIAAPTPLHHEIAVTCIEGGRHVLVEKPIAASVEDALDLVERAERANVILGVAHVERFNPAFRAARSRIGAPVFIEAHRLAPFVPRSIDVDVILDLMIHDLDLLLSTVKGDPERVDGAGVPVITPREDIANARVAFTTGAVANLTASRVSREKMRRIRFFTSSAYVSIDLLGRSGEAIRLAADPMEWIARGETPPPSALLERDVFGPMPDANPLLDQANDFVTAIRESGSPEVTGRDGTRALALALTIGERVAEQLARVKRLSS